LVSDFAFVFAFAFAFCSAAHLALLAAERSDFVNGVPSDLKKGV